jgi:hypothetical protein
MRCAVAADHGVEVLLTSVRLYNHSYMLSGQMVFRYHQTHRLPGYAGTIHLVDSPRKAVKL